MATTINMPKLSLTMTEGSIVEWLKKEGEPVRAGEPLVEILTDKVTQVEDAPVDGVLLRILAPKESVVPVGDPIVIIGDPKEALEAAPAATAPVPAGSPDERIPHSMTPAARRVAREKGLSVAELEFGFRGRPKAVSARELIEWLAVRPKLTPLAAKVAGEHGLDPRALPAPADGSRVRAAEIERLGRRQAAAAVPAGAPGEKSVAVRKKLAGIRKLIAERMVASKQTSPHVTLMREIDVVELEQLRRRLSEAWGPDGVKVTATDFCVRACAKMLEEVPQGNSSLVDGELISWADVNIGVACATPQGLMVPVVRHANQLTLREISAAVKAAAQKAREGKLSTEELTGGTFTVSNLGMFGVDAFTPVINQPEAAILGVGRVREQPAVWNGEIVPRKRLTLSLAFDHRIVDGAEAAQMLDAIAGLLENPFRLLD